MAVCGSQNTDPSLSLSSTEFDAAQAIYQKADEFQLDFPECSSIHCSEIMFIELIMSS